MTITTHHLPEDRPRAEGRVWASAGFLAGVVFSVAGNVAHTWHPSAAALAAAGVPASQWQPVTGAQITAAFFPVALLITVEVLSRVSWPSSWGWAAVRYIGAGMVAAVAAIVSYLHLRGLLTSYGEDQIVAFLGPLAVDGLMIVCGFALLAIGRAASAAREAASVRRPAANGEPLAAPRPADFLPDPAHTTRRAVPAPARPTAAAQLAAPAPAPAVAPGAETAAAPSLVSVSDSPEAVTGPPVASNIKAAVRMLIAAGEHDPAAIAAKVPGLLGGKTVNSGSVARARRQILAETRTGELVGTGAYL